MKGKREVREMFMKKRNGFIGYLVAGVASGLIILIIVTGVMSYVSIYDEHIRTMHQQNRAMINRLDGWLTVKAELVENSAMIMRSLDLNLDQTRQYLHALEEARGEITIALLSFQDGRIYSGGDWALSEGIHVAEREWFEAAAETPGEVAVSRPFSCSVTNQLSFAVSRTVSNHDESMGVIALTLPFDSVINYIREGNAQEVNTYDHFYLVVDSMGYIIFYDHTSHLSYDEAAGYYQNILEVYEGRYAPMFYAVRAYGRYSFDGTEYLAIPLVMSQWYVIIGAPVWHVAASTLPTIISLVTTALFVLATCVGFMSMFNKLKRSAEAEQKSHEITRTFLNSSPFLIEVWNSEHKLIECNDSVISLFGLKRPEDFLEDFFKLSQDIQPCGTPAITKLNGLLEECFRDGKSHAEWVHLTTDGEVVPVDVTYVRLKLGNEDVAVGYSHDLRQIKLANEKMMEAEKENISKSRFLAQMSHEIRTPMNAVLGITEIELHKDIHPPETEEAFHRIYNSSRLLVSIINDILDLSQIDAGKMKILPIVYEMASLVADTVQLNLLYLGSKPVNFNLALDENLPETLFGDELRIKQILNNILSNAFKYTSEGVVTMDIGMEKTDSDCDIILVIKISDSGQGLSKEQISSLFSTDYTRFNQEQNRSIQGSGLGLNIVHSLVRMMDGDISVKSELNKGSEFTVRLPQKAEGSAILGKETAQRLQNLEITKAYLQKMSLHSHELMPYGRVLVVDDVETNLYVMRGFLQHYKMKVETADGAAAAISLITDGQVYDIIFMDHMMPEMNGIEATKIIREMGYVQPIVALTANAVQGASAMFMSNGFSDFVSKPIDPTKLDDCLMKFVYSKQPPEVIAAVREKFKNQSANDANEREGLSPDLIKSFLMDANSSIAAISNIIRKEAIDDDALRLYTTYVHGIKTALANINQPEASEFAASLEGAGLNADIAFIENKTAEFLEKLSGIAVELSNNVPDSVPDNMITIPESPADNARAAEKFKALAAACEAYETQTAQDLTEELKALSLSSHVQTIISEIETHILLSNDEDAAALAKDISERLTERIG